jgi:hypothetical protein
MRHPRIRSRTGKAPELLLVRHDEPGTKTDHQFEL